MDVKSWHLSYITGLAVLVAMTVLQSLGIHPEWTAFVELTAGIMIIAGACEAFVHAVEGISHNLDMTDYVSGIYASLASTIPELSVITFLVVGGEFEMAWVLALATIFVNSLVFAVYSLFLPKDERGNFQLPDAIMWVGSDLLSMAAVISLSVGLSMLMLHVFAAPGTELLIFGLCLIAVFVAYLFRITKYYGKCEPGATDPTLTCDLHVKKMPRRTVVGLLFIASLGALLGGEALASFADYATQTMHLTFIHAALLLVVFGGAPEYIIVASSHKKEQVEVALSNAFGGIVQVFFVIFGYTLIVAGLVGGVVPIDLFSVVLLFFAFPSLFILRVMITDDSKVNNLEAIAMISVFIMMLYMLLRFGGLG